MSNQIQRRVAYVHSPELTESLNKLPKYKNRANLVHELISAYRLTDRMQILHPNPASDEQMLTFHSEDYIQALRKANDSDIDDDSFETSIDGEEFGLGYDCPLVPNMYDVMASLAGATITAAQVLVKEICTISINWGGGWHHAKKDEAAGFCYINDIVLGILELKKKFPKVLYVDLDVHHGDGVEAAFAYSPSVFCFSVHKYEDGFYPGSGSVNEVGYGKGRHHTLNLPLKDGIRDDQYKKIVCRLLNKIEGTYKPDAVVCQCGADALYGDPVCGFNLTLKGIGSCIEEILAWNLPTLLLGGGGYNFENTARCWTYLTSLACRIQLSNEIPDHNFLLSYGPDYELHVAHGNRSNANNTEYLYDVLTSCLDNINALNKSRSVPL